MILRCLRNGSREGQDVEGTIAIGGYEHTTGQLFSGDSIIDCGFEVCHDCCTVDQPDREALTGGDLMTDCCSGFVKTVRM